jgi:hypothetical protein
MCPILGRLLMHLDPTCSLQFGSEASAVLLGQEQGLADQPLARLPMAFYRGEVGGAGRGAFNGRANPMCPVVEVLLMPFPPLVPTCLDERHQQSC